AFDVAIFLASYIIDDRANFLGGQQHLAASDGAVQGRLITGKRRPDNRENLLSARVPRQNIITDTPALSDGRQFQFVRKPLCVGDGKAAHLLQPGPVSKIDPVVLNLRPSILLRSSLLTPRPIVA